ncbi:MAG: alanyl-tRNA editing protein [Synergistaceae bacterium]|nr:alanyl-tRNA editing protein [Synergistaceae bacterium]
MKTHIESILPVEGKEKILKLVLSPNPFHPSGGGQPGDTGKLRGDGFSFSVTGCEKTGENIAVIGKTVRGTPVQGIEVEAEVDMDLHTLYSRMHTGEHILSRILERSHPGLSIYKVAIGSEESTVYLSWEGELDWSMLFAAEGEVNGIIAQDLLVETLLVSKDEAKNLAGIKANWQRIEDKTIRVVRIPDFDLIACSGSHVASTKEVEEVFISGFRGSAPSWEIKFTLGSSLRKEYCSAARRLVRRIGCPVSKLEDVFSALTEENASLRKLTERAASFLTLPWEEFSVKDMPVFFALLPDFPREMVTPAARTWSDGHPDALCLVLLPQAEKERGAFLFYRGRNIPVDFSSLLRESPSIEARGGGRADWLNGITGQMKADVWLEALGIFIEKRRP